ncbi:MAG: arsenite methyltransferase [Desulfobacteraceae bacterium]|jgi:SAM-dependent methyltransferase|nr:arsenite methyltransferase [Desulfobacteraceae bacterium]
METLKNDEIRQAVRQRYSRIVDTRQAGCGCAPGCCGAPAADAAGISRALGYSPEEVGAVPEGANLGLGCGNPQAIAALKPGEVVLDLGSGGGFDCFLAARQVGETGRVIGVDMTPEIISRARANAAKTGHGNVEFRLGEIENLPVADNTADVVISNCVINLSPDKPRVFAEIYRALKPGGRLAVSDVVATAELPEAVREDMSLRSCCIAGASMIAEVETMLHACGFVDIRVTPKEESKTFIREWAPGTDAADFVVSADIHAVKPTAHP